MDFINCELEKTDIETKVKDILVQAMLLENNYKECEVDWYDNLIAMENFDSITMVNFMVAVEEEFQVYIDEASMEKVNFMGCYQNMIDGIVNIIIEKRKENV